MANRSSFYIIWALGGGGGGGREVLSDSLGLAIFIEGFEFLPCTAPRVGLPGIEPDSPWPGGWNMQLNLCGAQCLHFHEQDEQGLSQA